MRIKVTGERITSILTGMVDDGIPLPQELLNVPAERLRYVADDFIDAADVTEWHVDEHGEKWVEAGDGRQPLTCAWDALLINDGGTWRTRTGADDVAAAIARKHADIQRWRDAEEAKELIFQHGGANWDGGLSSRTRLETVLGLPGLPPGFYWTDADNNDVPVTMEDLEALHGAMLMAMAGQGFAIHQRQRAMKDEVSAMIDAVQIAAYVPGWA